jgi:hypothetical protein
VAQHPLQPGRVTSGVEGAPLVTRPLSGALGLRITTPSLLRSRFLARAVPAQPCAAASITACVSQRMLRSARKARAFSLAQAFARASCSHLVRARAACMCAPVSPCKSRPVRSSGPYFVLFGVFALTGRSSGTRRNSCFESSCEFVDHRGVARPLRRAP